MVSMLEELLTILLHHLQIWKIIFSSCRKSNWKSKTIPKWWWLINFQYNIRSVETDDAADAVVELNNESRGNINVNIAYTDLKCDGLVMLEGPCGNPTTSILLVRLRYSYLRLVIVWIDDVVILLFNLDG